MHSLLITCGEIVWLNYFRLIHPQNRAGEPMMNPNGKYFVSFNLNGCRRKVQVVHVLLYCAMHRQFRPVARGGSGGSIEPPFSIIYSHLFVYITIMLVL